MTLFSTKNKPPSEKSIMLGIASALGYRGWLCLRVPPSIYSAKGWCDLIAIKWGMTVYIECKSERGKLSQDQRHFGDLITRAGGLYIVAKSVEFALQCLDVIEIEFNGMTLKPCKGMRLVVDGKN